MSLQKKISDQSQFKVEIKEHFNDVSDFVWLRDL